MFYDYRSDEIIQDIIVDDISEILEDIYDEYYKLRRGENICIYCTSIVGKNILHYMLEDLQDVYVDAYSDNYILTKNKEVIINISYDGNIFIEDAYTYKISNNNLEKSFLKHIDGNFNYFLDTFVLKEIEYANDFELPVLVFGFSDDDYDVMFRDDFKDCECSGYPDDCETCWYCKCGLGNDVEDDVFEKYDKEIDELRYSTKKLSELMIAIKSCTFLRFFLTKVSESPPQVYA